MSKSIKKKKVQNVSQMLPCLPFLEIPFHDIVHQILVIAENHHRDQVVAKFPARRLPISAEFRHKRSPRFPRGGNFSFAEDSRAIDRRRSNWTCYTCPTPGFTGDAYCYSANELDASSVIEELSGATRNWTTEFPTGMEVVGRGGGGREGWPAIK